jgi:hypothetical protein
MPASTWRDRKRYGSRRIWPAPEVRATIEENFKLAEAMGMNGTPSYVIGKQVVVGAVGLDGLKEKIGIARCGKRPSLLNPTIELRVADSCTRLDDAVAIAALFRCLVRALDRDRSLNAGFDRVGRAITQENKWNAQRHGIEALFVDPFTRSPLTAKEWLDQVLDFIAEDVAALGCEADIAHIGHMVDEGTSADRQIEVFAKAKGSGRKRLIAAADVVDWAATETLDGDCPTCARKALSLYPVRAFPLRSGHL